MEQILRELASRDGEIIGQYQRTDMQVGLGGIFKDENECELVVEREGDFYRITGFDVLNLKATLYCSQAFRWKEVKRIRHRSRT